MLDARDVERAIAGTYRLMRHERAALMVFDNTNEAFWRSFWALALVLPAFVVQIAGEWRMIEATRPDTLPDLGWFIANNVAGLVSYWLIWPAVILSVTRMLKVEPRFCHYMVVSNWTTVATSAVLAVPMALYIMGWALSSHAAVFSITFMIVIAHFRWYVARQALGVSAGVAALIVALDAALAVLIVQPTLVMMVLG